MAQQHININVSGAPANGTGSPMLDAQIAQGRQMAAVTAALASCEANFSDLYANGGSGGESAYQIAVSNGFVGTQSQWLASLQGAAGAAGNTVRTTSGAPSNGTGNNGDYAIDPTAQIIYGPKTSGTWPAGVSFSGSGGAAGTWRNIATRCRHNYQTWTTAGYALLAVSEHINQGSSVSSVKLKYGNWYANNVQEYTTWTTAGAVTYYAAIEYPAGTYTPVEWATQTGTLHARGANCALGSNVTSDACPVPIPRGAKFKVHVMLVSTSGSAIVFPVSASSVGGGSDAVTYAAAALTIDPLETVMGGATTGFASTGSNFSIYPLSILGQSTVPSVILYGDSRLSGRNDSNATTQATAPYTNIGYWGVGEIARTLDYALPYANIGCESDTILNFTTGHALRAALAADHQYVHFEYGINDITAGRTASTIEGQLTTAYGYFPSQKISQSTIPPKTTSTDSWATAVNQTVDAFNSTRTAINDWIRTKPSPLWEYFEVADLMETARDSGIWKNVGDGSAPVAMTGDGLHETPYAYNLIKLSGNINTTLFT